MRYFLRQRPMLIKTRVKVRRCVFLGSVHDTVSWISHVSRFILYHAFHAFKTEHVPVSVRHFLSASHPKSVPYARLPLGFKTHPIFRHNTYVGHSHPHGFRSARNRFRPRIVVCKSWNLISNILLSLLFQSCLHVPSFHILHLWEDHGTVKFILNPIPKPYRAGFSWSCFIPL